VGFVVLLAFLAALNPTLLAATTVMLLLPHPERLMFGYWLGSMFVSVTLGLVIVYALQGASVVSTTKNTLSPAADFALAAVMLIFAAVLASSDRKERTERKGRRHRKGAHDGKPSRWQEELRRGSARSTFVIGGLLSLPGATYLAALGRLHHLHYSTTVTVLVVIGFNLIQLLLLEVPMIAFKVAPSQTPAAIDHLKERAGLHWRKYAAWGLVAVAALLILKGVITAT
jgi:hypothetical protein